MKKLALIVTAAALVLALAACGEPDNNAGNSGTRPNSSVTDNSGNHRPGNDRPANNGPVTGGAANNGNNGSNSNSNNNSLGDRVENAVDDLMGDGHSSTNGQNKGEPASFRQMLDNARVE